MKYTYNVISIISVVLLLSFLSGCASTQPGYGYAVKAYSGAALPVGDTAIVKAMWPLCFSKCNSNKLDTSWRDFGRLWPSLIALQPGENEMEVRMYANTGTRTVISAPIKMKLQMAAGRKYAIFSSWIVSNRTESISDKELWDEAFFLPGGITLHEEVVRLIPTILDVTTDDDVKVILNGQYDWHIRLYAVHFCSDKAFLRDLLNREGRPEVREAVQLQINLPGWLQGDPMVNNPTGNIDLR